MHQNGQLARTTTRVFLRDTDAKPTLYLRRASRLKNPDPSRATIIEGDVLDARALTAAMKGRDVVYANLAGEMKRQAEHIVEVMHETGLVGALPPREGPRAGQARGNAGRMTRRRAPGCSRPASEVGEKSRWKLDTARDRTTEGTVGATEHQNRGGTRCGTRR
ncbi:MAG: NAD(P)H-binding protein [Deltaproteobacteria bacterium]|nr:NAD(P)H-binding protein [Deltaproteobacteria bacterium]